MPVKAAIIGISGAAVADLPARARQLIEDAELLFGSERLLALLPDVRAEKIVLNYNIPQAAARIRQEADRRIVVLASGDPGFFGVSDYLSREVGAARFEVIPALSSVQLAFARLDLKWDDACLLTVHGRDIAAVLPRIARERKLALLTDAMNSPSKISAAMLEAGLTDYRAWLCEDLDLPGEKVTALTLSELAAADGYSDLNVLILRRDSEAAPCRWGIPDDRIAHGGSKSGLITKLEVRAVSLAKLGLTPDSIVWDVGAGSGAVSLDAARLADDGMVYAVEPDAARGKLIAQNRRQHRSFNITLIEGSAPEVLNDLPAPDAVFVGGSGGRLEAILEQVCRQLKPGGRVVLNLVTLENLSLARRALAAAGLETEIVQVQVSRGAEIAGKTRFEPLSPVYIVTGVKHD